MAGYRFDRKANIVCAFPEPGLASNLVEDTYRRSIVPIIQHLLGKEALHASAVLTSGGVVGLVGASRAGKSTLAFGLSRRGHPLWSDDSLVLDISQQTIQAIAFPFRLHLRPASATFYGPEAAQFAARPAAHETGPAPQGAEAVSALFILEQRPHGDDATEIAVGRVPPDTALSGLLRHAYCFSLKNYRRKRLMMTNYLTLAARVPVFAVQFAPGLERVPQILDRIEHTLRPN